MNSTLLSGKMIIYSIFIALIVILWLLFSSLYDNQTKIVFCDVGQGDGAYIRLKNSIDIVVDAGPDRKILECLGKYMPFYDRTIEMAFLSHPQKDHMDGYIYILQHYTIERFFTNPLSNNTLSFKTLYQILDKKHVRLYFPFQGDIINLGSGQITFLWPTAAFIKTNITKINQDLLQDNLVGIYPDNKIFGRSALDPNLFSQTFLFETGRIRVLFTGDNAPTILDNLTDEQFTKVQLAITPVTILKVPHHGSKNGLTLRFLTLADPALSVISVGRRNSYGHPSPEIIDMFKAAKKQFIRTDQEGTISFTTDGGNVRRLRN